DACATLSTTLRARAQLDSTTKVRRKRAPIAELESSANPQPGKATLRSARFPACGFWRLSSRQMLVLSSNFSASRAWKGAVTPVSSAHNERKTHTDRSRSHAQKFKRYLEAPKSSDGSCWDQKLSGFARFGYARPWRAVRAVTSSLKAVAKVLV